MVLFIITIVLVIEMRIDQGAVKFDLFLLFLLLQDFDIQNKTLGEVLRLVIRQVSAFTNVEKNLTYDFLQFLKAYGFLYWLDHLNDLYFIFAAFFEDFDISFGGEMLDGFFFSVVSAIIIIIILSGIGIFAKILIGSYLLIFVLLLFRGLGWQTCAGWIIG